MRRRWSVLTDDNRDSHDLSRLDVAEFWPCPAVDDARGQMKQKIDNARRLVVEEAGVKSGKFWPDAREARDRRKKRVENGRAHSAIFAKYPSLCAAGQRAQTISCTEYRTCILPGAADDKWERPLYISRTRLVRAFGVGDVR